MSATHGDLGFMMPRFAHRIHEGNFPSEKIKMLSDEEWSAVEQAYGQPLPPRARALIHISTLALSMFAASEGKTLPVSSAKDQLKRLKKEVLRAKTRLPSFSPTIDFEQTEWSVKQIHKKFFAGSIGKYSHEAQAIFPILELSLNALLASIEFANQQMSRPDYGRAPEGYAWETWIQDLTQIARMFGLPYQIRKDWDKQAELSPSPFVKLVMELQKHLPTTLRRHYGNGALPALTQAIYRTRKDGTDYVSDRTFGLAVATFMFGTNASAPFQKWLSQTDE